MNSLMQFAISLAGSALFALLWLAITGLCDRLDVIIKLLRWIGRDIHADLENGQSYLAGRNPEPPLSRFER